MTFRKVKPLHLCDFHDVGRKQWALLQSLKYIINKTSAIEGRFIFFSWKVYFEVGRGGGN